MSSEEDEAFADDASDVAVVSLIDDEYAGAVLVSTYGRARATPDLAERLVRKRQRGAGQPEIVREDDPDEERAEERREPVAGAPPLTRLVELAGLLVIVGVMHDA